jgi:hypothetical protein
MLMPISHLWFVSSVRRRNQEVLASFYQSLSEANELLTQSFSIGTKRQPVNIHSFMLDASAHAFISLNALNALQDSLPVRNVLCTRIII